MTAVISDFDPGSVTQMEQGVVQVHPLTWVDGIVVHGALKKWRKSHDKNHRKLRNSPVYNKEQLPGGWNK